jgi:hypothetical protein
MRDNSRPHPTDRLTATFLFFLLHSRRIETCTTGAATISLSRSRTLNTAQKVEEEEAGRREEEEEEKERNETKERDKNER